jgi:hypothetical protein
MQLSAIQLRAEIAFLLAQKARRRAKSVIESRTLRDALEVRVEHTSSKTTTGIVHIPHYWAVYYHDGRRGFGPKKAKRLVFFKNPSRDPRIRGGRPKRYADARRLTRGQFYAALEGNEIHIRRRVGPAAGKHFFTKGMRGFLSQAREVAVPSLEKWILDGLREDGALNIEDTATGVIRVGL